MSMTERHPRRVYFLYGHQNPPPSLEAAHKRLDMLEQDVQQVRVQVEFSDPNDFSSDGEFRAWKARALRSIATYLAEMSYLRVFVNGGNRVSPNDVEQVRKDIDKITKNVRIRYQHIVGDGALTDVITVEQQHIALKAFLDEVGNTFVLIRQNAKEKGIGKRRLSGYWRDLSNLSQEMHHQRGKMWRFLCDNGRVKDFSE